MWRYMSWWWCLCVLLFYCVSTCESKHVPVDDFIMCCYWDPDPPNILESDKVTSVGRTDSHHSDFFQHKHLVSWSFLLVTGAVFLAEIWESVGQHPYVYKQSAGTCLKWQVDTWRNTLKNTHRRHRHDVYCCGNNATTWLLSPLLQTHCWNSVLLSNGRTNISS